MFVQPTTEFNIRPVSRAPRLIAYFGTPCAKFDIVSQSTYQSMIVTHQNIQPAFQLLDNHWMDIHHARTLLYSLHRAEVIRWLRLDRRHTLHNPRMMWYTIRPIIVAALNINEYTCQWWQKKLSQRTIISRWYVASFCEMWQILDQFGKKTDREVTLFYGCFTPRTMWYCIVSDTLTCAAEKVIH